MSKLNSDKQLVDIFNNLNDRHFGGELKISAVAWAVPISTSAVQLRDEMSQNERSDLERAISLAQSQKIDDAMGLVENTALNGLKPHLNFCILCGKEAGIDVGRFVKVIRGGDEPSAPGALLTPNDTSLSTIIVHPGLNKNKTPKSVLRYVIWHEMVHLHLGPSKTKDHPDIFRGFELTFGARNKAVEWLREHDYAVLDD